MKLIDRIKKGLQAFNEKNNIYSSYSSNSIFKATTNDLNVLKGFAFACIEKRATSVSEIENYIEYKGNRVDNHYLNEVLFGKSKKTGLSWSQEKRLIQWWLDKTGNAYIWYPKHDTKLPQERIFIPSNCIVGYKQGKFRLIDSYKVKIESNSFEVDASEMVHFKTLTASNQIKEAIYFGTPLLVNSIADVINADAEMFEYITKYFENETIPPMIFKSQYDLSAEQIDKLDNQFKSKFKGSPPASFYLSGGLELSSLETSSNNLSSVVVKDSLTEEIRNRICIAFGVVPTLLTGEFQNKTNSIEINKQFWENTISPLVNYMETSITDHVRQFDDIIIKHNERDFIDINEQLAIYDYLSRYNYVTAEEVRATFGLNLKTEIQEVENLSLDGFKIVSKYALIQRNLQDSYAKKIEKETIKVFKLLDKEIQSNLTKKIKKTITKEGLSGDVLFDVDKFIKLLIEATQDVVNEATISNLNQFLKDVGSTTTYNDYVAQTTQVGTEVNKKMSDSIKNISVELDKLVKDLANKNANLTPNELMKLMVEQTHTKFNEVYTKSRAELIGRQTSNYVNESIKEKSANKLGLGLKWVHIGGGGDNRPHHVSMTGKVRQDDGLFHLSNGVKMPYPKGSGIANEDINCNCSTVAFKKK